MPGSPLLPRRRTHSRLLRPWFLSGTDYGTPKRKTQIVVRVLVATSLAIFCMYLLKQTSTSAVTKLVNANGEVEIAMDNVEINAFENGRLVQFSKRDGKTHVLVTGGAGYIGSHAALRLLEDGYRVTIVDNLSRGNLGAIKVLEKLHPKPGSLQFIYSDLGDNKAVNRIFSRNAIDAVMHFAAVAYVGESMAEPLRYYHNITSNTINVLEAMDRHNVKKLIYSSTCATYGEPDVMPITETTPQVPINPYGKAKKMAEDVIKDYSREKDFAVTILRYFNVIGSDPKGRLGEVPRPELRHHGRISGACFDAASGLIDGLQVKGTDYETKDGTCVRDYIHVTDLVDAHVRALERIVPFKVNIYNVGTGQGRSVKEFAEACKHATGVNISVHYLDRRPGDYAEVWSNPSKIKEELNWTAKYIDLTKALEVAWQWRKSHPKGYTTSVSIV